MPPQEQAELWMALRDRMSADWNELTLQEKKAGTFGVLPIRGRGKCCIVHSVLSWINAACFGLKGADEMHAT
jgi:hypothetical protein